MNNKKAKRLRQLVKVMQDKGVVKTDWELNGGVNHEKPNQDDFINGTMSYTRQSVLDPTCGKSVYKQMKKRV